MRDLAVVYAKQGRYDASRSLLEECLDKRKSILGDNHPLALKSMRYLAVLYNGDTPADQRRRVLRDFLNESKDTAQLALDSSAHKALTA
jgi:hypothetical protein